MIPFLQQVAHHYLEADRLEDYCFVFPNRRSGQFFAHYLQQELTRGDAQPHLMPQVTSINEFVARLTHTVAATDIEMMFALYDAYCGAMGDKAQEFDKFIYWAQLIISDFNDIDRSLADAHEIYRNLDDLHGLSSNYLTPEVEDKVRRIFGESLFTAFFDTSADADMWQQRAAHGSESHPDNDKVKQEFMSLWNALETIYNNYHQALAVKGVVAPGQQLRMALDHLADADFGYARMVFVGFGVLSAAEVKLFDHFKQEGQADFWWDNAGIDRLLETAPHDPGAQLIKGYCDRFGAMAIAPLEDTPPSVRVVSIPSNVGQAKQAFNEVELMKAATNQAVIGIETAIVLPDETLLVPLLHSVHGVDNLNVTLGYPLRSSGIVSLMHIVARLHHQATKERDVKTDREVWTYYREDVNDILSHPLIKTYFTDEALAMATSLARTNRFRVPAQEFADLEFRDLFAPAMDSSSPGDERERQASYLDRLLAFCNLLMGKMAPAETVTESEVEEPEKDGVEVPLQQAFLLNYIDVLNQLKRALAACGQTIQRSTLFYLIDRLTAAGIVPFTGTPLRGLQVMGLLETRSLDFENVVILSMNERVFPRRRSINSFIPNYIRRAHGMSTIEQQEAIVAYNFYRLLNRARNVSLLYDSSTQKMGSSEPSRYITQLEKVYGLPLQFVEMSTDVETSSPITIQVPSVGAKSLKSVYTRSLDDGGRCLSASAINKYINCPLSFYLHYVQGLNEDNEVSDFMDYGTFGDIIHDTLNSCYSSRPAMDRGGLIDEPYIEDFKKNKLKKSVERHIKKHYLHVSEDLLDSDTSPLRGEALMLVDTIESYVRFVLDHDLELILQQGPITILECERRHLLTPLQIGGAEFNFSYTPDRVDRLSDGTVRIVDYKTGKDETVFQPGDGLSDLFNNTKKDRRKAILQIFLYCYAYLTEHPEVGRVMPVIYKLASMDDSGVKVKSGQRGSQPVQYVFSMDDALAEDFAARLAETVQDLYDSDFIQAPDGAKCCNYCRFIDLCRRTPSRY